jgi:hypothetical protein
VADGLLQRGRPEGPLHGEVTSRGQLQTPPRLTISALVPVQSPHSVGPNLNITR